MKTSKPIAEFMSAIRNDARIGTTHIALYVALYDLWLKRKKAGFLDLYPEQVMKSAKILSRSTYLQAIRCLHDGGYLIYEPSYSCRRRSRVRFKN